MITLKKATPKGYAEEGQTHMVKFAFANRVGDNVTEMFSGVVCRDFLGDCLHAEHVKSTQSIWMFSYDPKVNKLDRDKLRFILSTAKDNIDNLATIAKNLAVMHQVEDFHGLEHTKLTKLEDTHYLLEADSKWMKTNYLLSYYTFLVKCASYDFKDVLNWRKEMLSQSNKEAAYLKAVDATFDKLTKNLFTICEPYAGPSGFKDTDHIGTIHNNTGFVSTCSGRNKYGEALKSK